MRAVTTYFVIRESLEDQAVLRLQGQRAGLGKQVSQPSVAQDSSSGDASVACRTAVSRRPSANSFVRTVTSSLGVQNIGRSRQAAERRVDGMCRGSHVTAVTAVTAVTTGVERCRGLPRTVPPRILCALVTTEWKPPLQKVLRLQWHASCDCHLQEDHARSPQLILSRVHHHPLIPSLARSTSDPATSAFNTLTQGVGVCPPLSSMTIAFRISSSLA
jgi:hypothetical protein